MGRQERLDLIKRIEQQTNSKLLVYMTGDRRGLETRISDDVFPLIYEHLEDIGNTDKITLFIYTIGGMTISGYSIVNLIREYCKEYSAIVPFKCLSAGTLMMLGANSIIMSKMGQLGPIDPSVEHPLGPEMRNRQNATGVSVAPVNVEDVVSFFNLAKKETKTTSEEELTKVLDMMVKSIHPLVLGAINRSRDEIRFLAKTLLKQHMSDDEMINSMVSTLVEKRFSHEYLMGRQEAKQALNLNVIDVSEELMADIMGLYHEYARILQLGTAYNPEAVLGGKDEETVTLYRSIIESDQLTHVYYTKIRLSRVQAMDPQTGVPIRTVTSLPIVTEWLKTGDV